jgi:ParB-like chromosome segregation protein Spo0J
MAMSHDDEARFPRLKEIRTHPALDYFPLMTEDEFARLVWSIRKIGLIHKISQDESGRIIDGRCRFLACEIAGVEPELAPPKDPVAAYIFAANSARRHHLTLGQRAMITVLVEDLVPDDGFVNQILAANLMRRHRGPGELCIADAREAALYSDYPAELVTDETRFILRYEDLAEQVGNGLSLAAAYDRALERDREAAKCAEDHQRLVQLRGEAPFVAALVDEGTLTLDQGLARAEETAAAPLLAEHVQAIRALGRRMMADALEIGRRLAECRRFIRSDWIGWLDRELGLTYRSALNFIRIHELASARSENFSDLDLPVSGLYLLAQPSTPDSLRDEVFQRAASGEALSFADIKREVTSERPTAARLSGLAKIAQQLAEERPDDALVRELQTLISKMANREP